MNEWLAGVNAMAWASKRVALVITFGIRLTAGDIRLVFPVLARSIHSIRVSLVFNTSASQIPCLLAGSRSCAD